jgi:phosphoribosylaminoimidazole carboxylase PurK protein
MKTIGIAGGGQLGMMLTEAAHKLGFKVVILDPAKDCPASKVAEEHIVGNFTDAEMIEALSKKCDVITFEIESANAEALYALSVKGFPIHPTPVTLSILKDKFTQKTHLRDRGIPVADFLELHDEDSAINAGEALGYPFVLKARSGGYDGRGNFLVEKPGDISVGLENVFGPSYTEHADMLAYAEKFVAFEKELAVVAARTLGGEIQIYPLVETIHRDHICHMTLAPANISAEIAQKAHVVAEKVLASFGGAGVFAIEMFLSGPEVLVNEIAPRVHNSGHWTIEGCVTSQFEQHIRAITGMPLGSVQMKAPAAVMINILGERDGAAEPRGITEAETVAGVKVHIYGKMETRIKRKMGHLTALGPTLPEAIGRVEQARALVSI